MKTQVIQTRLDNDIVEKLKRMAGKQERTVSALIRFVLKNYLKENADGEKD